MQVMKPLYFAARTLSVATALTVIFAGSAYALDGNDVAKRLQARFQEQGIHIEFGDVNTDGSTITLNDSKIDLKSEDNATIDLGKIVLNNVTEDGKGGYIAETATLQDIDKTDENATLKVKGIVVTKLHIAGDDEQDPITKMMYYQSVKADSLTVTEDGEQMIAMKELYADTTPYDKDTPVSFNFGIKSISLDIQKMEELRLAKEAQEVTRSDDNAVDGEEETTDDASSNPLLDLGYTKLNMSIASSAVWAPQKGDLSIDKLELDVKDLGKLNTTIKLGGYDVKFVKDIQQASEQLNKSDENSDAAGLAMLGLIQQLSVSEMSISYDDKSLTNKLLDYYAKQQGIGRADMINQIKGIAPLMVGYLGNADFAISATNAINTYLDDPKSLTVSAQPKTPVSFALIGATATADPTKLLELLAVKIVANK